MKLNNLKPLFIVLRFENKTYCSNLNPINKERVMYTSVKIMTLFVLFLALVGCAQKETTSNATQGAIRSGAIGMATGGPQRAAASAVGGAAVRTIGGKIKDSKNSE